MSEWGSVRRQRRQARHRRVSRYRAFGRRDIEPASRMLSVSRAQSSSDLAVSNCERASPNVATSSSSIHALSHRPANRARWLLCNRLDVSRLHYYRDAIEITRLTLAVAESRAEQSQLDSTRLDSTRIYSRIAARMRQARRASLQSSSPTRLGFEFNWPPSQARSMLRSCHPNEFDSMAAE